MKPADSPFLRLRWLGWLALSSGSLCAAAAAMAQDSGARPGNAGEDETEIVVSASPEEIDAARNYVKALQVTALDLQVARWADPICVGVTGTTRPIAEQLAGRINAAASRIGAKRGEPGCKPNLLVVFTQDASAFMAGIRRNSPERLREIPKRREAFTFGKSAPVRWWYSTDVRGSDGRPLTAGTTGVVACAGPCSLPSLNANVRSQSTYSSSIARVPTVRHIVSAVVVIDVPLAAGRSVDSLGDYAALVGLAEIWPLDGVRPQGTILSLFDAPAKGASDAPLLSAMDRRFLCALYRLPLDRSGLYHRSALQNALSLPQDRCFEGEE